MSDTLGDRVVAAMSKRGWLMMNDGFVDALREAVNECATEDAQGRLTRYEAKERVEQVLFAMRGSSSTGIAETIVCQLTPSLIFRALASPEVPDAQR